MTDDNLIISNCYVEESSGKVESVGVGVGSEVVSLGQPT